MANEVQILLVEDDKVDVMAVQRAFRMRKIGNPLVVANDGVEALEILRGEHAELSITTPYIIVLDINMPRMNGLQFLDELRRDPQLQKSIVFVLTTSKDDEDRAQAYSKNIAGYITKSDFEESFLDAVTMLEAYWKIIEFPV